MPSRDRVVVLGGTILAVGGVSLWLRRRRQKKADAGQITPMNNLELSMFLNSTWPSDMEAPPALAVINTLVFFQQLPTEEKLKKVLVEDFLSFPRFRAVAERTGTWRQIDTGDIDLSYHIRSEAPCSSDATINEAVERLACQPLDTSKPLWAVHLIPRSGDGQPAMLFRIHHTIGDGVHLTRCVPKIFTNAAGEAVKLPAPKMPSPPANSYEQVRQLILKTLAAMPAFISNALASKGPLGSDIVFSPPPADRLALKFSRKRKVILVPPHSLKYVKAIKDAAHVTVNDVLMGATAGALRRYCEQREDPLFKGAVDNLRFKSLVPVALPATFDEEQENANDTLTNNWCFCSASMPLDKRSPLERVLGAKAEMSRLKKSMRPLVGLWTINNFVPLLPLKASQDTARDLFARHGMVFSNVPGPQETVFFAGEEVMGFQSVFLNVIPQVILISYAGKIFMNYVVDPDVVKDSEAFGRLYLDELAELGQALSVSGGPMDA